MLTVVTPRPASRSGKSARPCATITVPKAQKKQKAVSSTTARASGGCGQQGEEGEQRHRDRGTAHHDLLARAQQAIHRSVGQDAHNLRHAHRQQHVAALHGIKLVDVVEIGAAPYAQHREHGGVGEEVHGEDGHQSGRGPHFQQSPDDLAEAFAFDGRRRLVGWPVAHKGVEGHRHQHRDGGQAKEAIAPAHGRRDPGERRGGGKGADIGGGEHPGHRRRELGWREPARAQEHRRHEGGRTAHADHGAATDQVDGVGGGRDPQRAQHGQHRQRGHRAARAVAVEPHADRHLHCEKREEEGAARPTKLPRAEAEVARQLGRDDAVGDAVELTEAGDRDQQQQKRQL